ncbi:sensor histidine kinase [Actinomadura verrucosospora]|uniref:histidine kinase n=1 Tax=Actinomadura verrucosospora TaxID=46165 RepID=A0A7D3ZPY8_ACTVE|nr:HAMP domain-containing sensor histidine kinase [Actinomadura verrucosospora]QKG24403.1 hypothetical protein ACTIVE_6050 [Actinomadura verrucosospora]
MKWRRRTPQPPHPPAPHPSSLYGQPTAQQEAAYRQAAAQQQPQGGARPQAQHPAPMQPHPQAAAPRDAGYRQSADQAQDGAQAQAPHSQAGPPAQAAAQPQAPYRQAAAPPQAQRPAAMQPHAAAQPEAAFHQAAAQAQTQYPTAMQTQAQQRVPQPQAQAPARQQAAAPQQAAAGAQAASGPAGVADPDVWPELCERFCLQFLVLAEKMRPAMDLLERQEEDPDRLEALYEIDHGVTRMRRAARDLRVLAGRDGEEASGADTSLLDVIRMAESSIEQYRHVTILRVVELAVPAYAAEDLASLVAALLDNATRYSPSRVTVSAHLLDNGAVMLRIEDAGIGMSAAQLDGLNTALAGPVPPMTDETSRQTGFPVVHRLARRHGIGVRLAGRTGGTVAMVTVPPSLLCEIPPDEPHTVGAGEMPSGMAHLAMARRVERPAGARPERSEGRPARPAASGDPDLGGLPRRERASLRPVAAPAPDTPSGTGAGTDADTDTDADTGSGGGSSFAADLDAFTAGARLADPAPEAEAASHDPEEGRQ